MISPDETILSITWEGYISRAGTPSGTSLWGGYALLITSERVVGSRQGPPLTGFDAYLGPGSEYAPAYFDAAKDASAEIVSRKDFEIPKSDITRIIFADAGALTNGYVSFTTQAQEVRIDIHQPAGKNLLANIGRTAFNIERALLAFAPDRLYNAETGVLIQEEMNQRKAKMDLGTKDPKKHWW
ncbi:MAG: hypothetical protein OK456_09480 [Thaumarchaeota archaeon]|nr:hypothetical protein [Nitrososphaerota archaeon]